MMKSKRSLKSGNHKHMQSVDTVDYDLSSSDDEAEAREKDIEEDLRVRIARD